MVENPEGEGQRFTSTDWDWVMFLSGEINAIETRFDTFWTTAIAILCAFMSFIFACLIVTITYLGSSDLLLVSIIVIIVGAFIFVVACRVFSIFKEKKREVEDRAELLEKCREDIFNRLDDPNKILKCYLNAVGKKGDKNK